MRATLAHRALCIDERDIAMENAPIGYLDSTLQNSLCIVSIGTDHDAITNLATVGYGSFVESHKVQIQGISFFPRGTLYAAKKY